ncbi:hypothetical protein [Cellulophaga sp. E6(2014)]|uniref:hypothetical protein n=1 Tax=Cellulophaga sp. E6(2014) TaxID=1495334 RepID=UPI00051CE702|nr:hypothetical protein [Cellulophaga sp. E6(2014)]KGK29157.1 hypothetical protein EL45_18070 [Cellulophaga sp. E6(2014)]
MNFVITPVYESKKGASHFENLKILSKTEGKIGFLSGALKSEFVGFTPIQNNKITNYLLTFNLVISYN